MFKRELYGANESLCALNCCLPFERPPRRQVRTKGMSSVERIVETGRSSQPDEYRTKNTVTVFQRADVMRRLFGADGTGRVIPCASGCGYVYGVYVEFVQVLVAVQTSSVPSFAVPLAVFQLPP